MTEIYLFYCTFCMSVRASYDPPPKEIKETWLECKVCNEITIQEQIIQGNSSFFHAK